MNNDSKWRYMIGNLFLDIGRIKFGNIIYFLWKLKIENEVKYS